MATVTVKNIPDDLYERLKQSAKANRRSVSNEIIICIERQVSSRRRDVDDILDQARSLRALTCTAPITHSQFEEAEAVGRPPGDQ